MTETILAKCVGFSGRAELGTIIKSMRMATLNYRWSGEWTGGLGQLENISPRSHVGGVFAMVVTLMTCDDPRYWTRDSVGLFQVRKPREKVG